MEGKHRHVEGLCLLKVVHSKTAKGWVSVDMHAPVEKQGYLLLHSSSLITMFSFLQAPVQGDSPERSLPSSKESFGMDPLAGRGKEKDLS